jgi:hypothetical protein
MARLSLVVGVATAAVASGLLVYPSDNDSRVRPNHRPEDLPKGSPVRSVKHTPVAGQYTRDGLTFATWEPNQSTHVVVLLYGGVSSFEIGRFADRLAAAGAVVMVPRIHVWGRFKALRAGAAETACAVAYAIHRWGTVGPLVMVGYFGGGYQAGLYVATDGARGRPEGCVTTHRPHAVDGVVLLDAPLDQPLFAQSLDPVRTAAIDPNPAVRVQYFVSSEQPTYYRRAAERFNQALHTLGHVTLAEATQRGLLLRKDVATAVLYAAGLRSA